MPRPASLILAVLLAAAAAAQTPDTTTAARYFPLAAGNEWHLQLVQTQTGQPALVTNVRHLVVGEEAPGHFLVQTRTVRDGGVPVDTVRVWRFDPATRHARIDGAVFGWCPLDEPFSDSSGSCALAVYGGYERPVPVGTDTVVTSAKTFYRYYGVGSGGRTEAYSFAAGVGFFRRYVESIQLEPTSSISRSTETLQFARVDGVEVGERLFPVASGTPPAVEAPVLSVGPNPAAGATTLRYTLDEPAAVRLSVLDALGREVALLVIREQPAGDHTVLLDARTLAPGVYAVRLTVGADAAVRRLTVVR